MKKPDCTKCRSDNRVEFLKSPFGKCNQCECMKKYEEYRISKRLFVEGVVIKTLDELPEQEWVVVNGRGKHIKAIRNMQFDTVLTWLARGFFKTAIRKGQTP